MSIRADISLETTRVSKLNFILNEKYKKSKQTVADETERLDVEFDIRIGLNEEDQLAKVVLSCYVNVGKAKDSPFQLEINQEGFFRYKKTEDGLSFKKLLAVNAVAILFPYLRATISAITANCGIAPIILPTINIIEALKAKGERAECCLKKR